MRKLVIDGMAIGLRRVERNVYTVVYHLGETDETAIGSLYQGNADAWRAMHAETGVSFGAGSQYDAAGRMAHYHRGRLADQAEAAGRAADKRPPAGQLSLF